MSAKSLLAILIIICNTACAQSWTDVGSAGFSAGVAGFTAIAMDVGGAPYIVYQDVANGNGITVRKYLGGDWTTLGSAGFTQPGGGYKWIAINRSGTPYVSFSLNIVSITEVMNYTGGAWVSLGSSLQAGDPSIAIDTGGTPYVVFEDDNYGGKATVMKYTGSSWVNVGSPGFSAGPNGYYISIAIDLGGTPYVAYQDSSNGSPEPITVMKYNGSNWVVVGNRRFSSGLANYPSLAIDTFGTPYVVYADSASGYKATVMKYVDTGWVTVGSAGFSAGAASYTSIAIDSGGTPYVVYEDAGNSDKATVMKYNGSDWVTVGSAGFSVGAAIFTSIAINNIGTPYVVYSDSGHNWKATVMKFGESTSVSKINDPGTALSVFPDPNHGSFTINISATTNEDAQVTITNIIGEKVKELTTTTNTDTQIHLDAPPGIYFISAVTTQGTQTSKIVVW